MREARLAGARARAAADDRRGRRAVVRRAERRPLDQRPLGRQQARDRVDARHLERLVAARAAAGFPADAARASSFRCPAARPAAGCGRPAAAISSARRAALLPAHVGEVGERRLGRSSSGGSDAAARLSPRRYATASARWRTGIGSTPASAASRRRLGGAEQPLEPDARRALGDRERRRRRGAARPSSPSSPDDRVLARDARRDLPRCGEDRERDREVEARAFLAEAGRREIDRDSALRPLELRRDDAAADPVLRLLARPGRRDRRSRKPGMPLGEVRLDLDAPRLEADERKDVSTSRAHSARSQCRGEPMLAPDA